MKDLKENLDPRCLQGEYLVSWVFWIRLYCASTSHLLAMLHFSQNERGYLDHLRVFLVTFSSSDHFILLSYPYNHYRSLFCSFLFLYQQKPLSLGQSSRTWHTSLYLMCCISRRVLSTSQASLIPLFLFLRFSSWQLCLVVLWLGLHLLIRDFPALTTGMRRFRTKTKQLDIDDPCGRDWTTSKSRADFLISALLEQDFPY